MRTRLRCFRDFTVLPRLRCAEHPSALCARGRAGPRTGRTRGQARELAYRLMGNAHEDVLTAFEATLKTVYHHKAAVRSAAAENEAGRKRVPKYRARAKTVCRIRL